MSSEEHAVIKVFCSYSDEDRPFQERLEKHLFQLHFSSVSYNAVEYKFSYRSVDQRVSNGGIRCMKEKITFTLVEEHRSSCSSLFLSVFCSLAVLSSKPQVHPSLHLFVPSRCPRQSQCFPRRQQSLSAQPCRRGTVRCQ